MCAHVFRGQRSASGVTTFSPLKLDMVPVRLWSASPAWGLHIASGPDFYISYWNQTKVPRVCKAIILSTEPRSKAGLGFTSAHESKVRSEVWFVNKSFNTIKSHNFISSPMYTYLCILSTVLTEAKRGHQLHETGVTSSPKPPKKMFGTKLKPVKKQCIFLKH